MKRHVEEGELDGVLRTAKKVRKTAAEKTIRSDLKDV